jgi:hypothetical protein
MTSALGFISGGGEDAIRILVFTGKQKLVLDLRLCSPLFVSEGDW